MPLPHHFLMNSSRFNSQMFQFIEIGTWYVWEREKGSRGEEGNDKLFVNLSSSISHPTPHFQPLLGAWCKHPYTCPLRSTVQKERKKRNPHRLASLTASPPPLCRSAASAAHSALIVSSLANWMAAGALHAGLCTRGILRRNTLWLLQLPLHFPAQAFWSRDHIFVCGGRLYTAFTAGWWQKNQPREINIHRIEKRKSPHAIESSVSKDSRPAFSRPPSRKCRCQPNIVSRPVDRIRIFLRHQYMWN